MRDIESARGDHVLAVGGASGLASELRQQFLRGRAEPGSVRLGRPEGADAYVHVLAGEPADEDVELLRRARRARVPAIAVVRGPARSMATIPYVLATDVVWVAAGEAFPLETIARVLAARLGERGAPLAARVPLLHGPVCERLLESFSRTNGLVGGIGRAGLPVLALNQVRLVIRLAQAYGVGDLDERIPELAATLGAGFGLRALARELAAVVPGAEWAVRCGVAYAGTRALGEAARLRFGLAVTPPRASASPAAP
ncbi:MAG TPA: hypothetical protein VHZ77_06840 [Gaiellaceae bacterium]|nr:hypothetical protein [Gaiellaceae bacterium]